MSAVDTSCYDVLPEKEICNVSITGAGEMSRQKLPPDSNTSVLVVSEIMNTILNNTFEIIMAQAFQQEHKTEKITSNVVGDILENILSSPYAVSNDSYGNDETVLLDDEIKRIIKEMKFPPSEQKNICCKGVGDQLGDKINLQPEKVLGKPLKRYTLDRKPRLTNLVRNSKQMLNKFITNDDMVVKMSKSEEVHEKLLKVTSFEEEKNGAEAGISKPTEATNIPFDSAMDMVDLEPNLYKTKEIASKCDEKVYNASTDKVDGGKEECTNKKKWNLGAKLMRYLKRHQSKRQ